MIFGLTLWLVFWVAVWIDREIRKVSKQVEDAAKEIECDL